MRRPRSPRPQPPTPRPSSRRASYAVWVYPLRMRRGTIFGVMLVMLLPVAQAHAAVQRPIVYAVVIDGLDGDKVDEGKAPFISSLLGGHATYYRESRSIMIAETNPNHTAMMTGAYGNASGFPGN